MKREKLGSLAIDTATVLVGDPFALLPEDGEPPEFTFADYIEASHKQAGPPPEGFRQEMAEVVRFHTTNDPLAAIAIRTCEGCDGYAPVYLERDAKGRPRRLIIDLVTRGEP